MDDGHDLFVVRGRGKTKKKKIEIRDSYEITDQLGWQ